MIRSLASAGIVGATGTAAGDPDRGRGDEGEPEDHPGRGSGNSGGRGPPDDPADRGRDDEDRGEGRDGDTDRSDVRWAPGTDPLSLTDKDEGQLVAAIPPSAKRRIVRATLFCPLNALESRQNTDRPTANENGLVTFRPVRRRGEVVDLRYEYTTDDADDLADLTQGHIHHAPRGGSDNRLFFALYAFSDLDGSDGEPRDPPIRTRSTLSEQFARLRDADFDDGFEQTDPAVPDPDDGFVAALARDVLANPGGYQVNAHTRAFRAEAIRGQVRRARLGRLSRRELVETVLATAGPDAL
jgi:hypothetical protein